MFTVFSDIIGDFEIRIKITQLHGSKFDCRRP